MTIELDDHIAITEAGFPQVRLRRLRATEAMRQLVRETHLSVKDMVMPLFIKEGHELKIPIDSMPGQYQFSVDQLDHEIEQIAALGIPAVLLFGIPAHKDANGSDALSGQGIIARAIQHIKAIAPELLVISDLCMCEYTDHGHCGVIHENAHGNDDVHNDQTLSLLAQQAVVHAQAGADVIAPSGMMDGAIQAIRSALDGAGFQHVTILSYAVKYASSFYGPFREAAEGAPQFGDRRSYQMDPANGREALREAALDVAEGADMLMVKPALNYLDVICRVKQQHPNIPLAAYMVSGEYAMIKAAAERGWLDESQAMLESLTAIKRAGADFIINYFAKDFAKWAQV
ncbi:MAG: porphobilinogen synthase [Coxiellaceae bacterium]|nr:porphobilinogen synthase [Coxiellaceae bacterium]